MANELKTTIINMKTLNQDISDPITVGAGEAAGRALRIIFTQEAAALFTPNTKVYLSWYHQEEDIKGYNVFTKITNEENEDFPPTWEISYPKSMLYEGNVLACIQIVDDISISTSVNFTIHVLANPNDGSEFEKTNDFSEFQEAIINLTALKNQIETQRETWQTEFLIWENDFENMRQITEENRQKSEEALTIANTALDKINELIETLNQNNLI